MKSEIIEQEGRYAVVFADPTLEPWERNRVAELTEDEGTDCWQLVDIRLKAFPQLSKYGCSTGADDYHATFTPENEQQADRVKSMLRDFREDADGSIHWCTFNGIVRGHSEVNGYRPARYLDFDQAGFFSREEGLEKLQAIKRFWDAHTGSLAEARIDNPHRQPSESEVYFALRFGAVVAREGQSHADIEVPVSSLTIGEDDTHVIRGVFRMLVEREVDGNVRPEFIGNEGFDATRDILSLPHDELMRLKNCDSSSEAIGRKHVEWEGPCDVFVVEQACAFFGVDQLSAIDAEMLAAAKLEWEQTHDSSASVEM